MCYITQVLYLSQVKQQVHCRTGSANIGINNFSLEYHMNYFLNLKNGVASISTSRLPEAMATDIQDIVSQCGNEDSETLTASLDLWIKEQCNEILENKLGVFKGDSKEDIKNVIFGEFDFLYELFEQNLDSEEYLEYPDLRDAQNDLVNEIFEKLNG